MSKIVFRNYDLKRIRELLKEIGKERYEAALLDSGMHENKPLSMDGFFIEFEPDAIDFNLYYKYPSRVTIFILPVLGYWNVPHENWVMERK